MEKSKMGRPLKSSTPLSHDVKVRLDDETFDALVKYCKENETEKASVIREALKAFLDQS